MQVNVSVDTEKVAHDSQEPATMVWAEGDDFRVNGYLDRVVQAVIQNLEFSFDRNDAELGQVIQFPGVSNS